jgi:hypothetical protein
MMSSSSSSSSSSELALYSPISTLERQYASVISSNPPPPQRVLLFASLNANCCLAAGVETILQQQQHHKRGGGGGRASSLGSPMAAATTATFDTTPTTVDSNNTTADEDDPFSFLHGNSHPLPTSSSSSSSSSLKQQQAQQHQPSSSLAAPFSFFKKVAHHTTQTLERSVQGLAIRADKGKSPDVLLVGLYDTASDRLLSCTESQPVPFTEEERLQGMVFHIPLSMLVYHNNNNNTASSVTVKVWIQSGATILGTKVAKHYYHLLGQVSFQLSVPSSTSSSPFVPPMSYLLQSHHVVNGQVTLVVAARDLKWPLLYTPGWSLAHPQSMPQSFTLYHPPLDQSYAYRGETIHSSSTTTVVPSSSISTCWCMATERAMESTVVLPVATAMMELAAQASYQSIQHATTVLQRMAWIRHDQPPPTTAVTTTPSEKAIGHLQLYPKLAVMTTTTPSSTTTPPFRRSNSGSTSASYYLRVSWQRPDCIFECELLPLTAITTVVTTNNNNNNHHPITGGGGPMIQVPFYPNLCPTNDDRSKFVPGVLPTGGSSSSSAPQQLPPYLLGTLRLEVMVSRGNSMGNPFDPIGTTAAAMMASSSNNNGDDREVWQNVIALEPFVTTTTTSSSSTGNSNTPPMVVRLFHTKTGQVMGSINLHLAITLPPAASSPMSTASTIIPSAGGLVSFMGLDNLHHEVANWKCPQPVVDYYSESNGERAIDPQYSSFSSSTTLGTFMTFPYLQQHLQVRTLDVQRFQHLAQAYRAAITKNQSNNNNNTNSSRTVPAHLDRSPKPFRPSSSRTEDLLSAIPFNVHIQSVDITKIPISPHHVVPSHNHNDMRHAMFHNVTCGAPADHARGFGNVFQKGGNSNNFANNKDASPISSPVGTVAGGLRRLEAKRLELAQLVQRTQAALAMGVASYQAAWRRQQQQQQQQPPSLEEEQPPIYIPARHYELTNLRWKVFEAYQALHHVTWVCAVRRAHCFSQALGVALSSYLTSVSNNSSAGWPEVWVRHGYLITFEGLLSAAGKELGMIEDASVAIAMLRQVKVVMVPVEDPTTWRQQQQQQTRPGLVEIPESPHLVYLNLITTTSPTQYRVELGMDANYYRQHLPEALKNGTSVTFYPLLFQVGVDIRQWGANAGNQVKNQLTVGGNNDAGGTTTGLFFDDDADDDAEVTDYDVLVQLNYEALRKLNAYVHALYPQVVATAPIAVVPVTDLLDTTGTSQLLPQQQQTIHPSLALLHSHILSSAGRMNHSILDEAATIGQQLGGGGVVFCKSGKDRTAMQVTYKQAQFVNRYLKTPSSSSPPLATDTRTMDSTLQDATLMRIYGTRLPICEKNVGQAKYAFNSLQVQFMPDALKPPPNTLAGFLKGGRIFGKGGIES